ncbi:MAG: hypothetical protein H0V17_13785 [Deltaproteobacteria bacterium]|nr:hypothetical protein [Deltaproteobacteria bacterium]
MKRLAVALAFAVLPSSAAFAEDEETEEGNDEEPDPKDEPEEDDKPEPKKPAKKDEFIKQDLTGHDQAGTDKANLFEKDRFFVDKVDTKKTSKGTLVQGNLTSTLFGYRESGGELTGGLIGADANTPAGSQFARVFTELRSQTDFRHIAGSRWDARADVRARYTTDPGNNTTGYTPAENSSSQSGFLGENELDIRELWLIRGGKRSDIILGRQFVADLAGIKFDGVRVDYASSEKFTFLGFGGLYPIRGSRSITTDYTPLVSPDADDTTGIRPAAGRLTGAGGFGAAYRTQNAYGAFGGVALVPLQAEAPRIFGTATGYWRPNPKVDFYHYAVLDLVGSNAVNKGLTNLSVGANLKPDQRLRATVAFNRVDTETLNVQAHAFLQDPDRNSGVIQNEAFLARVAQNSARASLSAGLGQLQRFEITVASALRYRGELVLPALMVGAPDVTLPAGKSVEVYGGIVDRRSFKKLRIGLDGSRIFKLGGDSYQRTTSNSFRVFTARELKDGRGEWEAEVSYTKTKDDKAGTGCADVLTCFGSATSTGISAGGNVYYRFNREWFGMTSLFLTRQSVATADGSDPPVIGLSGFFRIAYRY